MITGMDLLWASVCLLPDGAERALLRHSAVRGPSIGSASEPDVPKLFTLLADLLLFDIQWE